MLPEEGARREGGASPALDADLLARLRRTNLNLLPILAAVLETGRISEAARQLNLTQPAVSQALRQLRAVFDDDLVVMSGRVPTLTERAAALLPPLRQLLAATDQVLREARPFDPARDGLAARIVTADYIAALLTPPLLARCAAYAPAHRIDFTGTDIKRMQDLSQVDLVILPRLLAQRLGKTHGTMPVFEDRFVCIADAASTLPDVLEPDEVRAQPQLRFALDPHFPTNTHHLLNAAADLEHPDAWSYESFAALALGLVGSDRIAVVPAMLARWIARTAPLRTIAIAGPARHFHVDAIWSTEHTSRPGHRWLREIVAAAAQSAPA